MCMQSEVVARCTLSDPQPLSPSGAATHPLPPKTPPSPVIASPSEAATKIFPSELDSASNLVANHPPLRFPPPQARPLHGPPLSPSDATTRNFPSELKPASSLTITHRKPSYHPLALLPSSLRSPASPPPAHYPVDRPSLSPSHAAAICPSPLFRPPLRSHHPLQQRSISPVTTPLTIRRRHQELPIRAEFSEANAALGLAQGVDLRAIRRLDQHNVRALVGHTGWGKQAG